MDFLELQQRLRDHGFDPFQAYAGRYGALRSSRRPDHATSISHGAWNLLFAGDGTYVVTVRELHRRL
ncbi:hypothetical protein [Dactylosporangium sp. NPDC051484]|uniref:hypothetical protein n=1 Tax=Dactylosporangium sp. NPDC051484 TaxID=3154942 RepID=UPI00344D88DE